MIFAKRLKELRKENGLLQKDLASVFNVRNTTISAWEVGDNEPDLTTLVNIAKYFGVTTDYLLGIENEDGTKEQEEIEYQAIKYKNVRRKL